MVQIPNGERNLTAAAAHSSIFRSVFTAELDIRGVSCGDDLEVLLSRQPCA